MSLLQLPPEAFIAILELVGSAFFQEDPGRLTVCKRWFEPARRVYYRHLALPQHAVQRLIACQDAENPSPITYSLEALDLQLEGYHPRYEVPYPQRVLGITHANDDDDARVPSRATNGQSGDTWQSCLNKDLTKLSVILQQSHKLRSLRICATQSPLFDRASPDWGRCYILLPTMRALLSLEHLSELYLDLSNNIWSMDCDDHVCLDVSALLGCLKTLHLRMLHICPDALKLPENCGTERLRLTNLVVNMSMSMGVRYITSVRHSQRCRITGDAGWRLLKARLQRRAEVLAARMASPKVVRILFHALPSFEIYSFDVLTGKTSIINERAAWDDDGRLIEEDSGSESSLLDDDFNGFLDSDSDDD